MKKFWWALVLILIMATIFAYLLFFYPIKYRDIVFEYSTTFNLEPSLIMAIIKNESHFKPDAVSSVGAVGLMQVMPSTASDVAKKLNISGFDLTNPTDNIKIGCWYLNFLMEKFDDEILALCAYNAGYNNVIAWQVDGFNGDMKNIPVGQTKIYVKKIIEDKKVYKLICK